MAEVSGSTRNGSRAAIFLADKKTKKDKKRQKKTRCNNKAGGYDQNFYFENVSKCIFKTFCKNRKRQADSRIHCAQVGWEVETAQNVGGIAIRVGFILVCA